MEIVLSSNTEQLAYSFSNKENYLDRIQYMIVTDDIRKRCSELALKIWNILGCRDGGRLDFRMDENGEVNFIEINPLPGLNHKTSDLPILAKLNGIEFNRLIEMIVNSAVKRI